MTALARRARLGMHSLEERCVPAAFSTVLGTQQTDISVGYLNNNWTVELAFDDDEIAATPPVSAIPSGTMLYVAPNTLRPAPAGGQYSFLGASSTYTLPQTRNTTQLFLGSSAANVDPTVTAYRPTDPRVTSTQPWVRMDLKAVRGPADGFFSVYQVDPAEQVTVWMASADGISGADSYYIPAGARSQFTWAFSKAGVYEIDLQPSVQITSIDPSTKEPVVAEELGPVTTYFFAVDPSGPVITAPEALQSSNGSAITFSSAAGTGISISGPTLNPANLRVRLSAKEGILTLGTTAGIVVVGGKNNTSNITISGLIANVNTALDKLTYTPNVGFNGEDKITITSDDLGAYQPTPLELTAPLDEDTTPDPNAIPSNALVDTEVIDLTIVNNPEPPPPPPPPPPPGSGNVATPPERLLAVGQDNGPYVDLYEYPSRHWYRTYSPYGELFTGGVRVATGDLNADGFADVVTGAGPGGGPHVVVFDANSTQPKFSFFAYDSTLRGGVSVAVGDVTGDGAADIVTGAGAGGAPHVRVFDGKTGQLVRDFFAFEQNFRGGIWVAATDLNGDNVADIVVGAGEGGGPVVAVFDGKTGSTLRRFLAYSASFRGGVYVGAGNIFGGSPGEIVTGAGNGGGAHVQIFSGQTFNSLTSFFTETNVTTGSRVSVTDPDPVTGRADVITASGLADNLVVRTYTFTPGAVSGRPTDLTLTDPAIGGVFVG